MCQPQSSRDAARLRRRRPHRRRQLLAGPAGASLRPSGPSMLARLIKSSDASCASFKWILPCMHWVCRSACYVMHNSTQSDSLHAVAHAQHSNDSACSTHRRLCMKRPARTRSICTGIAHAHHSGDFALSAQVRHKVTGRQYALKVVDKHLVLRHRLVGQLRQERNILDRCAHDSVARLHFTFQDEGAVYLGLELCPNGPRWLTPPHSCRWTRQLTCRVEGANLSQSPSRQPGRSMPT